MATLEEIRKKLQQAQQANQSESVAILDPTEKKRQLKRLKELFARLKSGVVKVPTAPIEVHTI